ncbi:DUF2589 domain-containing protein [Algoriphagus confluentis]|uniref:DUF2589 domain-containing protein n=1 Tax=Algoriphagus confluentis TaxID=1697556 RepID=A0ABQ6PLB0_9BACT|nr:DUF2589 domain-containing protein [Algoriphagus confluentis]
MITPRYISDLLGAPLAAVVQAEAIAAKATAEFIQEVGFSKTSTSSEEDFGEVRNIIFSYQKVEADGSSKTAKIAVPLLTIIPIPSLKVAEAEIEFDLALSQPDQSASVPKSGGSIGNKFIGDTSALRLKGIFGKKPTPNQPNTTQAATANMNVKIRLAQAEPAIGMVQLLNILDNANKET